MFNISVISFLSRLYLFLYSPSIHNKLMLLQTVAVWLPAAITNSVNQLLITFMWNECIVKALDVNVIASPGYCETWKKALFFYSDLVRGPLIFFCPFFSHMDFLKAVHRPFVITAALPPLVLPLWRSRKVMAAIPHWNSVWGSSVQPYSHSVGLFSHNNDAAPPSQPQKCQKRLLHVWVSSGGRCVKRHVKRCWETVRWRIQ